MRVAEEDHTNAIAIDGRARGAFQARFSLRRRTPIPRDRARDGVYRVLFYRVLIARRHAGILGKQLRRTRASVTDLPPEKERWNQQAPETRKKAERRFQAIAVLELTQQQIWAGRNGPIAPFLVSRP